MDGSQAALGVIVRQADPHEPLHGVLVEGGQGLLTEDKHAPGIVQEPRAIVGDLDRPARALEKLDPEPLLQASHLHGNGGLGLEHVFRRAGEASRVHNGDEGAQLVEIDRRGHGSSHHEY